MSLATCRFFAWKWKYIVFLCPVAQGEQKQAHLHAVGDELLDVLRLRRGESFAERVAAAEAGRVRQAVAAR